MNANAKKLVAALRSGEFQQGRDALRRGDNFCCLGIACELYRRETRKDRWRKNRNGLKVFMGHMGSLPPEVREWLGFKDNCGSFRKGTLACLNDCGATFAELADLIESEPKGLLVEGE